MSDPKTRPQHQREHLRAIASKGGLARAAKMKARASAGKLPYGESFLAFVDQVGRSGASRVAWRVFWKAADGLLLEPDELPIFQRHTGRSIPPTSPAKEIVVVAGRRSGKSEQMITRATWRAISRDWSTVLASGEKGVLPVIAADKSQSANTLNYLKGLTQHPLVQPYVVKALKESVEFKGGVAVKVLTASWRSTRGFTFIDAILEEAAFYSVEGSANPDEEILHAIRPGLLTVRDGRVHVISSPYSRHGILWQAYEQHFGKDESDTLVWVADTLSMNPSVDPSAIEKAFAEDPSVAMAEYGKDGLVSFRSDVERLISKDVVDAVVVAGRRELPRMAGVRYVAFVDPSGGSQDAMTVAVAHKGKDGVAVLDCLRERRAPFSPESVVEEFAGVIQSYGLAKCVGDRYGGLWPGEQFQKRGIRYEPSEKSKTDLYVEVLPLLNAAKCELLDHPRLVAQLCSLERRTSRGTGRDVVDHPPGGHDDLSNCVAGALVLVGDAWRGPRVWFSNGPGGVKFDSWAATELPEGWAIPEELDENGNP